MSDFALKVLRFLFCPQRLMLAIYDNCVLCYLPRLTLTIYDIYIFFFASRLMLTIHDCFFRTKVLTGVCFVLQVSLLAIYDLHAG